MPSKLGLTFFGVVLWYGSYSLQAARIRSQVPALPLPSLLIFACLGSVGRIGGRRAVLTAHPSLSRSCGRGPLGPPRLTLLPALLALPPFPPAAEDAELNEPELNCLERRATLESGLSSSFTSLSPSATSAGGASMGVSTTSGEEGTEANSSSAFSSLIDIVSASLFPPPPRLVARFASKHAFG